VRVRDADCSRKEDKKLNKENGGHRSVSARSTRWLRPFIPPDGTHYASQCKQTDNDQEEDEGHEEKEGDSHRLHAHPLRRL
jgi:hypothetical protein